MIFARTQSPQQRALGKCLVRCVLALVVLMLVLAFVSPAFAQVPREALRYQGTLKREAHRIWGLDAPVATFAAQIHQESRWRPDARSPVGALGLTQFMPATATWIGTTREDLREVAPLNPTWAIRALVSYDLWLWQRVKADDSCERMAFALQSYNSGLGWVYKRQRLSPRPGQCLGLTCSINPGVTPANQREAEMYPRLILIQHQPLYATWGPGVCQ